MSSQSEFSSDRLRKQNVFLARKKVCVLHVHSNWFLSVLAKAMLTLPAVSKY